MSMINPRPPPQEVFGKPAAAEPRKNPHRTHLENHRSVSSRCLPGVAGGVVLMTLAPGTAMRKSRAGCSSSITGI